METRFSLLSQQVDLLRKQEEESERRLFLQSSNDFYRNTPSPNTIFSQMMVNHEALKKDQGWFSKFKLFVIIFQGQDEGFKSTIKKNYEIISRMSGNKCLVISFLTPDDCSKCADIDDDVRNFLIESEIDSEYELIKIRRIFKLESKKYPLLLLTNDINSNEYYAVPTSSENVVNQLFKITSFSESNNGCSMESDVKILVEELAGDAILKKGEKKIVELLTDIEAEHIGKKDKEETLEKKRKWRDDQKNKLINEIKSRENIYSDNDEIDLVSEVGESRYYSLIDKDFPQVEDQLDIQNEDNQYIIDCNSMAGCEEETIDNMSVFNCLSRSVYNNDNVSYKGAIKSMCFCLGQMFEIEIIKSVVQKMRQALGIAMPGYFCLYFESKRRYYVEDLQDPVNLNKFKKEGDEIVWEPPTLGQSKAAFKSMIDNNRINVSDVLSSDDFLQKWTSITNCRNNSGHTKPIEQTTLDECWESFNVILRKYLPSMIKIKKELRPTVQQKEVG